MSVVGILALQGCVDPHERHFAALGVSTKKIKTVTDLKSVDRLVLPGGESTTMLKLLHSTGLFSAIIAFAQEKPIWGICAGAILIAKEVMHPQQESLGLMDVSAERNYYGSQQASFEATVEITPLRKSMVVQFIRAPLLSALGSSALAIAFHKETPILFQQQRMLASSFHVELGDDSALHQYFLDL
jgi:5'-phosphate synthase pdxT subunit